MGNAKVLFKFFVQLRFAHYTNSAHIFQSNFLSVQQVIQALDNNFDNTNYLQEVKKLEFFGNNNDDVDNIASDIFNYACNVLQKSKTAFGNYGFMPACIMFNTALSIGKKLQPLPTVVKRQRLLPIVVEQ